MVAMSNSHPLKPVARKSLCGKPKDEKARLSNVVLTILQKMEVNAEIFVDSLGPVSELI